MYSFRQVHRGDNRIQVFYKRQHKGIPIPYEYLQRKYKGNPNRAWRKGNTKERVPKDVHSLRKHKGNVKYQFYNGGTNLSGVLFLLRRNRGRIRNWNAYKGYIKEKAWEDSSLCSFVNFLFALYFYVFSVHHILLGFTIYLICLYIHSGFPLCDSFVISFSLSFCLPWVMFGIPPLQVFLQNPDIPFTFLL